MFWDRQVPVVFGLSDSPCRMATQECPCGYFGDSQRPCSCTPAKIKNYRSRVSGPLLDRIDIQVEVPRVKWQELSEESRGESSAAVSGRVKRARAIQRERFKGTRIFCNAHMSGRQVKRYCQLDEASRRLFEIALGRLGLSARLSSSPLPVKLPDSLYNIFLLSGT